MTVGDWNHSTCACITQGITAFASAWLDNVTTMLLMGPMTISVYQILGRDPVPLLVGMVRSSQVCV